MSTVKQSFGWWCFVPKLLSSEQFVRTTAEIGFAALDIVPPEYWNLVTAHGLAISSISGHGPLEVGMNRRDQHDQIAQSVRTAIRNAERLKVPNVICFSGNRSGLDDATGAEATAEALARLAPEAEAAGVTLVLELLNSKVDHRDYQADHTAWGLQVCKMVDSPAVKLLYDIYHMQIMEGDIIRTIQAAHPYIGLYHTAGNPGRNDLDDAQELHYPPILRAIRDTGYTGFIAHEFLPKGDPVAALQTVFKQCEPYL